MLSAETPWHHVKHIEGMHCDIWHRLLFDMIGRQLPIKFAPRQCQKCWKIVVRPKNLKQLFQLLQLQEDMAVPSKCGIEKRDTVHGLYGGYFYTKSLAAGMRRYRQVRDAVDKRIDKDISVILKRGCTEFELAVGDSKYYTVPPWQAHLEDMVDDLVAIDNVTRKQPDHVLNHVHRKWVEWAYANGDPTYAGFTDGKRLYPELRTYHHLEGCTPEEMEEFWEAEDTVENSYDPKVYRDKKKKGFKKPVKDKMVKEAPKTK